MENNISGNDKNGQRITLKVGDRVRFDTNSNIGIREDVVRTCFMQTDSLGNTFPAVVLTEHSWTPLSHIMEVVRVVPDAVSVRLLKDWRLGFTEPVLVRDRYRRTGWYVANPNSPHIGKMYHTTHGRLQAARTMRADVEVLS